MNTITNYYQILGVSSDAESFVIRAAYKALLQKYHPDKYEGDKKYSTERIYQINEAFSVLSDMEKRRNYDAILKSQQSHTNYNYSRKSKIDMAWAIILKYHPSIDVHFKRLQKFSDELANDFKLQLTESKDFDAAKSRAEQLEQRFLQERFGKDPRVLKFAQELFLDGQKAAAKELNETLIALGEAIPFDEVYIDIQKKYRPEMYASQKKATEERKASNVGGSHIKRSDQRNSITNENPKFTIVEIVFFTAIGNFLLIILLMVLFF